MSVDLISIIGNLMLNQNFEDPYSRVMITPSEVMEYLYCPRFTYFLNVVRISQYEDKRFKVLKGRHVHEERSNHNKRYLRKKIPALKKETDVYLANESLHIRGIVDEILFKKDGTLSPVDYKFSIYKEAVFLTHKIQLAIYGLLIEDIYRIPVRCGYIAYIRNGTKTATVNIDKPLKTRAKKIIKDVMAIIISEIIPKKTPFRIKCVDCTYKNICV